MLKFFFLFFLFFPLALGPLANAQETLFNKMGPKTGDSVEVRSLFGAVPTHGHAPIRVTVTNGASYDRAFALDFVSEDKGFGFRSQQGSTMQSSFSLTAKAGRTVEIDLVVPVVTALNSRRWGGDSGMVSLEVTMGGSFGSFNGSMQSWFNANFPGVLLSESLHRADGSALDAELASSTSSGGWGNPSFAGNFTPATMPEDWRAYSGFDAIMITGAEWTSLTPGARTAILEWTRLGGRLVVYATDKSANLATLGIGPETTRKSDSGLGTVEILEIAPSLSLDPKKTVASIAKSPAMLGSLTRDIPGNWPVQRAFGQRDFHYIIFLLVLIVFAVLVGPINLFVFAKSGRRHRLFITTPIISLSASAVLVLLIILQDGFGGRGFRVALVEIRPGGDEHLAYLHQEQFSRTGVLLGRQFEIDETATIAPVPLAASRWARVTTDNGGGNARYSLQPSGTKSIASGDWFQSRSEQGQILRAIIPTRGRIELLPGANPPRLMSSFDFPVEHIYFTDESGEVWTAAELQPGSPAVCQPVTAKEFKRILDSESALLSQPNRTRLDHLAPRLGHFIASSSSGFLIDTYKPVNWTRNHCILTGPVVKSSS